MKKIIISIFLLVLTLGMIGCTVPVPPSPFEPSCIGDIFDYGHESVSLDEAKGYNVSIEKLREETFYNEFKFLKVTIDESIDEPEESIIHKIYFYDVDSNSDAYISFYAQNEEIKYAKVLFQGINYDIETNVELFDVLINYLKNETIEETNDSDIINGLLNMRLDYKLTVPDNQLSYNYLWNGYDESNKFGPNIPKNERMYTYLTEYGKCDEKFYLVYLKKNEIVSYYEWLSLFEEQESRDDLNYHFSTYNDEKIIDGKYFYCYQMLKKSLDSSIKFYIADSINDIKFVINDYQLVLCTQRKTAIIKENLTTQKLLNKEIYLYNRYELVFDEVNSKPQYYLFQNKEQNNQKILKNMFDYEGEMIEAFPISYESLNYSCFPILGLGDYWHYNGVRAQVKNVGDIKSILLPRYVMSGEDSLDLLSYDTNLFFEEDVFGEYKSVFASALIKETDIVDGFHLMALYDYNKVCLVINKSEE